MKHYDRSTRVVASAGQFTADLGEEAVVLSLSTELYYRLADVGARIWELVQAGTTVGEVEDAVLAEYEVEPDRCRRDVQRFLAELEHRGMIDIRDLDELDDSDRESGRQ